MAEKQIAPLLCLQLLIPFIFNLVGCFISMPDFSLTIKILQWVISVSYISFLVFGNVFKEKCVLRMIIYFIVNIGFELLVNLLNIIAR